MLALVTIPLYSEWKVLASSKAQNLVINGTLKKLCLPQSKLWWEFEYMGYRK